MEGALINQAIHTLDLLVYLLGSVEAGTESYVQSYAAAGD